MVQFLLPSLSDFPDDEPECPQTHLNRIEKTKNMKLSLGFKSHPECFGGRLYPDLEIYGSFRKCCSVAHTSTKMLGSWDQKNKLWYSVLITDLWWKMDILNIWVNQMRAAYVIVIHHHSVSSLQLWSWNIVKTPLTEVCRYFRQCLLEVTSGNFV